MKARFLITRKIVWHPDRGHNDNANEYNKVCFIIINGSKVHAVSPSGVPVAIGNVVDDKVTTEAELVFRLEDSLDAKEALDHISHALFANERASIWSAE